MTPGRPAIGDHDTTTSVITTRRVAGTCQKMRRQHAAEESDR